jgi:hypothetical protein
MLAPLALLAAAATAPHAPVSVSATATAEIVPAQTVTSTNADVPRGEAARVYRDENGTAWVEFV